MGSDSQTCVTCGKQAPETETNYTLISAQFGWRLTRYKRADGSLVLEWRCPTCWKEFKRSRPGPYAGGTGSTPGSTRPSSAPPDMEAPPGRPGRLPR
ncbi:MAG TPA: hypothetical protein VHV30_10515 [Polyangiaceae bacterium]|nr:hypothetical protein [Polyangiaceae bacterium]